MNIFVRIKSLITFVFRLALIIFILMLVVIKISFGTPEAPIKINFREDNLTDGFKYSEESKFSDATFYTSYIEFEDDGTFANKKQFFDLKDLLLNQLNGEDSKETTIILYVHGWNHNASPEDNNVACFKELLHATAVMQKEYRNSVHGIYVGWPGLVYDNDFQQKLTFFGRQAAADRVGTKGDLLELFRTIREIQLFNKQKKHKFIIFAHSLGGRLTYKAIRHLITNTKGGTMEKVADLVLMVNPAISADEMNLYNYKETPIGQDLTQHANKAPNFVIATSTADDVLRTYFGYSQKAIQIAEGDYLLENKKRHIPLGLHEENVTHKLSLNGKYTPAQYRNESCKSFKYKDLDVVKPQKERVISKSELYNYDRIQHYSNTGGKSSDYSTNLKKSEIASEITNSLMVVEVAKEIIPDHNTIFTSPFVTFINRIINNSIYKSNKN